MKESDFYPALRQYCGVLPASFEKIPAGRKAALSKLADYIFRKRSAGQAVQVTVICTHNSRRSHMGQLWLLTAAAWYGIDEVYSFSGGTEATAFHPNAVAALQRAGFGIVRLDSGSNPRYQVQFYTRSPDLPIPMSPSLHYSKVFTDPANPQSAFAAVMVCSDADEACPFVPGADARFSLPFDDPKQFDGTELQETKYDETCRLIAREMFFVMHIAHEKLAQGQNQ